MTKRSNREALAVPVTVSMPRYTVVNAGLRFERGIDSLVLAELPRYQLVSGSYKF